MKKNIIKTGLIIGVFMLGLFYTNHTKAAEQCHTVQIFCADGSMSFGLACGSTYEEYLESIRELHMVVCGAS